MSEVRIFSEGALSWVDASAHSGGWLTASAPNSALIGFVQVGTNIASARQIATISNRGKPSHHKVVGDDAIEVQFTYLEAVSGNMAPVDNTAEGAAAPMSHFEVKTVENELGSPTARYIQLHHGALVSRGWTDGEEGNQFQETWRFISYNGPTASGYLAHS